MMHVRFSLISADPRVLAGCIGYLEDEARPVLESQHGSLGVSLLEGPGGVISESFWATHAALWLSQETDAKLRGELARRVQRPVTAEDYQMAVFEREARLAAEARDKARAAHPVGPLHGIPVAIKDLFDYAGHRTGAGSKAWSPAPVKITARISGSASASSSAEPMPA